jgi:nucleotide-binding universal stress UspA family protein
MFKHLLLPTDGSDLSVAAIQKGIQIAQGMNAKVTGLHVQPKFHVLSYHTEMLEDTKEGFQKHAKTHAEQYLGVIARAAKEANVICDTASSVSDHSYEEIIRVAGERRCDLIVMASHGLKGLQGLLLGSETQKVLTHSTIPVLVYR